MLVVAWALADGWMLVAFAGCCCWLLLLIAAAGCCCWLLVDCWLLLLIAAVDCCCWLLLLVSGWLLVAAADCCCWNTACWWKDLWVFSGYWWFAAKTILQAKKSSNIFRDNDDLRPRQFWRRKSLWIFSPKWWGDLAKTKIESVPEYFQSKNWALELWWKESGGEFRLGEID